MNRIARGAQTVGRGVREVLLTLAALGGVVCIVLVILAYAGGYSLIMFKTGSMSPTIPAGSVALVQEIPASEVVVGDVVTVDRDGALPITHRVIAIDPAGETDARTIRMRGDANDVEDPEPYVVEDVRIVRGSLPGLASVVMWFGSPWVLGGVTVGATALVVWAFWPRNARAPSRRSEASVEPSLDSAGVAEVASTPSRELATGGALRRDRRS